MSKHILNEANLRFEVEQWREFLQEAKAQVIRLQDKLQKAEEEYREHKAHKYGRMLEAR